MTETTLWGAVLERARARPEAPLVLEDEGSTGLTYAELVRRASRMAVRIRTSGRTGQGEPVAVSAASTSDWVVLWAATQAAGVVMVAVDPADTDEALRARFSECGIRLVLTDEASARRMASWSEAPEVLYETRSGLPVPDAAPDVGAVKPGDPSAVFFTSGSTGEPLGAMLSHRGILSNCTAVADVLRIRADERTMVPLPFHHIYGFSVLLSHIIRGACVVPEPGFLYPQQSLEKLRAKACTGFSGVAFHYRALLERTDLAERPLSALRYWTQAGEAMPEELTRRLLSAHPDKKLYLMYGQTEASPRITILDAAKALLKPLSVGSPLPGVRIDIRDEEGRPVETGAEGEVVVAGAGVMLGYWNRPDQTARVFDTAGWMRTGDIGRLDAEGDLYITGRKRHFLKVGGRRVVPEEIEIVLRAIPGVRECAVVGTADAVLGERPLAIIAGSSTLEGPAVLEACRLKLPPHKVPKAVRIVDRLPRTSAGKMDWAGLRRLGGSDDRKEEAR